MTYLNEIRRELLEKETVEHVEVKATDGVIDFTVDRGEYDSLTADVMSVLVNYDMTLYSHDMHNCDYTAVK